MSFIVKEFGLALKEDHTYAEVHCHTVFVTLDEVQNKLETL